MTTEIDIPLVRDQPSREKREKETKTTVMQDRGKSKRPHKDKRIMG